MCCREDARARSRRILLRRRRADRKGGQPNSHHRAAFAHRRRVGQGRALRAVRTAVRRALRTGSGGKVPRRQRTGPPERAVDRPRLRARNPRIAADRKRGRQRTQRLRPRPFRRIRLRGDEQARREGRLQRPRDPRRPRPPALARAARDRRDRLPLRAYRKRRRRPGAA